MNFQDLTSAKAQEAAPTADNGHYDLPDHEARHGLLDGLFYSVPTVERAYLATATALRPAFVGGLLAAAGMAIGNRAVVRFGKHENALGSLFVTVVGPPNTGKHDVFSALWKPIRAAMVAAEREQLGELAKWAEAKKALPKGEKAPPKPKEPLGQFTEGATPERAFQMAAANGGRLAVVETEAASFLGNYAYRDADWRGTVNKFLTEGQATRDTVGHGRQEISKAGITYFVAMQPDLLGTFHGKNDLGFDCRVLHFDASDAPVKRLPKTLAELDAQAMPVSGWTLAVGRIMGVDGHVMRMSTGAYELHANHHAARIEAAEGEGGATADFWGKIVAFIPRLAALHDVLRWAFGADDEPLPVEASADGVRFAWALAGYLSTTFAKFRGAVHDPTAKFNATEAALWNSLPELGEPFNKAVFTEACERLDVSFRQARRYRAAWKKAGIITIKAGTYEKQA